MDSLVDMLVRHPRWLWVQGMRWTRDVGDLLDINDGLGVSGRVLASDEEGGPMGAPTGARPDLDDPITVGALVALLQREAYIELSGPLDKLEGDWDGHAWWCRARRGDKWIEGRGNSMGEAVADALLALWNELGAA